MKTAMQELIEYVEELYSKDDILEVIVNKANMLLEKEKEQIIQAKNDPTLRSPLEYYNQTYNQNK